MYREMIKQSIENVYQAGVATKILQYMGKVRNESDIIQARRWVMELLQNARDLAYPEKPVKIKIILGEDALYFLHTGKPFRVKDILSIVNQVSSKKPGEGVGQFGTGFMTTYQLSERVQIRSVLHEENRPYKEFCVTLDRSGRDKEKILEAIGKNIEELTDVDEIPEMGEYDTDGYHTEFLYFLENEQSRRIARTGVTDLAASVLYIMAFSDKIGSIEIIDNRQDGVGSIRYERGECSVLSGGIERLFLWKGCECHTIFCIKEEGLTLAVEYDEEKGFLPISECTSKLFVDFPLVGSENFPFPVVLNHLGLHTNEPRSGISLVDNEASVDAAENKKIMDQAVRLFERFVTELIKIDPKGIEHIISISDWKENKEWSEKWVKQHLYEALYQIICRLPLFLSAREKVSLSDPEIYLIYSETAEETEAIQTLVGPLKKHLVPTDTINWYRILSGYGIPEEKVISLQFLLENAKEYIYNYLDEEEMTAIAWCSFLYHTAVKNPELGIKIQSGDIAVFPSQDKADWEQRNLYNIREIYQDPGIPEQLKDVVGCLEYLDYPGIVGAAGLRRQLLHNAFELEQGSMMKVYELSAITDYIHTRSDRSFQVKSYNMYRSRYENAWFSAWNIMAACGPDEEMYDMYRTFSKNTIPQRQQLKDERFPERLWENTYKSLLKNMISGMENHRDLESARTALLPELNQEEFYTWLNCFYGRCMRYIHSWEWQEKEIFPNQKGVLKRLFDLSVDGTSDELKEIAACFVPREENCDFYRKLLDKKIIPGNCNLVRTEDKDVALQLENVIQKLLAECSLSRAELVYQEACTNLLGWIEEHLDQAKQYFPTFCNEEGQMKLLTPKAAVSMHKKAKGFEKLMDAIGMEDPEEIARLINVAKQMEQDEEDRMKDKDVPEYDPDYDIWLDDELRDMEEEIRSEILQEIGEAGEQYAFERIRQFFADDQYNIETEDASRVKLHSEDADRKVQDIMIYKPDTKYYHQSGWDIQVVLTEADGGQSEYYLEVKTHTPNSRRRGLFSISNEQMKMAASKGECYVLLSVVYDYKKKQVRKMDSYKGFIRQLAEGKMCNMSDGYVFIDQSSRAE